MGEPLPRSFYERGCVEVARDLLGQHLVQDDVVLRISEVEAYCGPTDSASHARMGRTARNAPLWGPAGTAYVYLCYGLHSLLNVVVGAPGAGEAVLIRAAEPVAGLDTVRARRGGRDGPALLTGPGSRWRAFRGRARARSIAERRAADRGGRAVHRPRDAADRDRGRPAGGDRLRRPRRPGRAVAVRDRGLAVGIVPPDPG